ncbi:hypothetical protein COZ55_02095 [archaeon CG_4_8_14_3_um_filter_38_5]|nr:MAG: hypothetical protein COZ55_02095 [archaeon CG_4_8_14_3_um_filter_38_5]
MIKEFDLASSPADLCELLESTKWDKIIYLNWDDNLEDKYNDAVMRIFESGLSECLNEETSRRFTVKDLNFTAIMDYYFDNSGVQILQIKKENYSNKNFEKEDANILVFY